MDSRLRDLQQWINSVLGEKLSTEMIALSNDASPRRYFALPQAGIVAVDTPLPVEQNIAFINMARLFQQYGLNVPQVFRYELTKGYMLLSDLGRRTYSSVLNSFTAEKLYQEALTALLKIQAIQKEAVSHQEIATFDEVFVKRELYSWQEWFVEKYLQIELSDQEKKLLNRTFQLLADNNAEQPQVLVHRDYHSRNLMVFEPHNPGILDFQDAVWGAVTYDLVSLVRDCYIDWPVEQVMRWVLGFQQQLHENNIISPVSQEQFLRWFDLMGVQRHLKAMFIFARLDLLYGKPGYLKDIPRTLHYVVTACKHHKELHELSQFIDERVMPVMMSTAVSA